MASRRLQARQLRGFCVGAAALAAALALAVVPASASAAAPVLEFVPSGAAFPIPFEADGGEVSAEMSDFTSIVNCQASHGEGEITGARAAIAEYVFTGCAASGGADDGRACQSEGAAPGEIATELIDAELVFIDQATHQVGMLLNPAGDEYMYFECGGEEVDAFGSFLSPVGPIDQVATSFSALLQRAGAVQLPSEYETLTGEKRQAIPVGEREGAPGVRETTGVELSFTILTAAPLEIKAVTAAEVEAKQREDEAAATKKRQEDEAAASAAAKKRQDEEAAAAAAAKKRQEDEAAAQKLEEEKRAKARRQQQRAKGLKQCRKASSKAKRTRCETRVKKKYSARAQVSASLY